MFDDEMTQQRLGVKSYAVSVSTLEEVFLRVGEEQEGLTNHYQDDIEEITNEENSEINNHRRDRHPYIVLFG